MSDRKFRQHPLSFVPGGCVVKTVTVDGFVSEKDWVKYPEQYINEILDCSDIVFQYGVQTKRNTIAEVYIDGVLVWDINDQDGSMKHDEFVATKADDQSARQSSWEALTNVNKDYKRYKK